MPFFVKRVDDGRYLGTYGAPECERDFEDGTPWGPKERAFPWPSLGGAIPSVENRKVLRIESVVVDEFDRVVFPPEAVLAERAADGAKTDPEETRPAETVEHREHASANEIQVRTLEALESIAESLRHVSEALFEANRLARIADD